LVVASVVEAEDPAQREEDLCAAACATYIVLLGAHARGFVGYWRTPDVLRQADGRVALGIPEEERVIGLVHLGPQRQEQAAPERAAVDAYVAYLP
jgi:nitroreductase